MFAKRSLISIYHEAKQKAFLERCTLVMQSSHAKLQNKNVNINFEKMDQRQIKNKLFHTDELRQTS